jgi:hypothetical protein
MLFLAPATAAQFPPLITMFDLNATLTTLSPIEQLDVV